MFAQHFIAIEVVAGGHLHGTAQKTFGPGEVQTGAHSRIEEQVVQVIDQRLVAGVQLQLMAWMLLQLSDKVLPGKGFAGIQQGDGPVQAGHFVEQAQHGAPATALPRNDVPRTARQRLQLVIDRSAFDPGDQHSCFFS